MNTISESAVSIRISCYNVSLSLVQESQEGQNKSILSVHESQGCQSMSASVVKDPGMTKMSVVCFSYKSR